MTTRQAADLIGYTWDGANRMLQRMSIYLPLIQERGTWMLVSMLEGELDITSDEWCDN